MLSLAALGIPLGFAYPLALFALLSLPVIWWLLRLTPPRPNEEVFPPTRILAELLNKEKTPAKSPWWLTLLRLLMAALVIFALAQTIWNPGKTALGGNGNILMIVENGWTSAKHWDRRLSTAKTILERAAATSRPVILLTSIPQNDIPAEPAPAQSVLNASAALPVFPLRPDYSQLADRLAAVMTNHQPDSVFFLSDGVAHEGMDIFATALSKGTSDVIIHVPDEENPTALQSIRNDPDSLVGQIIRLNVDNGQTIDVVGYDIKGLPVTRKSEEFEAQQKTAAFKFDVPVELRNDIVRIEIEGANNAGANRLLDESNRRRLVGLISGEKHDVSQPLLSPLYYISRALEPFSDIRRSTSANVAEAVPELIAQGVSIIVLADVGILQEDTVRTLQTWIEKGGMLARFAGPRLAAATEIDLLPVRLRLGDRNIGGALSWEEPKQIAPFEPASPFYGISIPQDVAVKRQVLALQENELSEKTWAQLSDGTPLVTAERRAGGWLVLFHIGSDATWSNLPLSGTFVDMLRRIVNQSRSQGAGLVQNAAISLPPLRTLNAKGQLEAPHIDGKPVRFEPNVAPVTDREHLPGLYGTSDGFRALNLFGDKVELEQLDRAAFTGQASFARYANAQQVSLKPWLLAAAAFLFILDCLAVLWMGGALGSLLNFSRKRAATSAGIFILTLLTLLIVPTQSFAQSEDENGFDYSAALRTRLAYVRTGITNVDEISEAGLNGLSLFLTDRTAIEPAAPIALDISSDELSFYPLIYWPIHTASPLPDDKTMARVDAYMKQGGSILFDTRDQLSAFAGGTSSSPEAQRLQAILQNLDIPPLEPVPSDHVLTKSFFILESFPGRYQGGDLWVEQLVTQKQRENRPARGGDGVSSILITSNDFAAAWAVDAQGRAMLPTVPPDPLQREYAFRVGVNLAMYTMTGNYKSDQVHIPALLERLGQ